MIAWSNLTVVTMLQTQKTGTTLTLTSTTPKPGTTESMPRSKNTTCNKKNLNKSKKKTFTTTKPWDREKRKRCTMDWNHGMMKTPFSKPDTSLTPKTTTKLKMNRSLNGTRLNRSFKNNKMSKTKPSKPSPAVTLPQSKWMPPFHLRATKTHLSTI